MKDIAMGVDSSTQSTTIVLRNLHSGAVIGQSRAKHPPTTPPCSEQFPEDWWKAFLKALKPLGEWLPRVACISVGGQGHGLVILDEKGRSVRRAKLWNDTESFEEAASLREFFPDPFWEEHTGSLPAPALTISKLLWVKHHDPLGYKRIQRVMLPCDYIVYRLTGKCATERGGASGTGYFNPYSNVWEEGILRKVFPELSKEALPQIVPSSTIVGSVQRNKELSLLEGAVVVAGTGDNMAAAIGLNGKEGDTMMSLGTSGTVYAVTSKIIKDTCGGSINLYADATGRFLPMVTTLNAAKVTDFFRRVLSLSKNSFDRLALEDKNPGDVTLLPYLDGERTPNLPHATGMLIGLKTNTPKAAIVSAVIRGVVCGLLEGRSLLEKSGLTFSGKFILTGGASQSLSYRQILADISGEEIYTCPFIETAAAGAALYAAAAFKNTPLPGLMDEWAFPLERVAAPRGKPLESVRETYRHFVRAYKESRFYEK